MRTAEGIRAIVLSAYRPVREALRETLGREGIEVVGESGSAREALPLVEALGPQAVVIDELLADGDARSVCRDLDEAGAAVACVVLTSFLPSPAPRALPGNPAFVLRQIAGEDLPQAIRTAARRSAAAALSHAAAGHTAPAAPIHRRILALLDDLRATGPAHLAVLVDTWEPAVLNHRPTSENTGCPCAGCGAPWPCPLLADIIEGIP